MSVPEEKVEMSLSDQKKELLQQIDFVDKILWDCRTEKGNLKRLIRSAKSKRRDFVQQLWFVDKTLDPSLKGCESCKGENRAVDECSDCKIHICDSCRGSSYFDEEESYYSATCYTCCVKQGDYYCRDYKKQRNEI